MSIEQMYRLVLDIIIQCILAQVHTSVFNCVNVLTVIFLCAKCAIDTFLRKVFIFKYSYFIMFSGIILALNYWIPSNLHVRHKYTAAPAARRTSKAILISTIVHFRRLGFLMASFSDVFFIFTCSVAVVFSWNMWKWSFVLIKQAEELYSGFTCVRKVLTRVHSQFQLNL